MPGIGRFTTDAETTKVVIDLESGTVLGTSLVMVSVSDEKLEELMSSDTEARAYGKKYGRKLAI